MSQQTALLKEIAEFLNEETELYSMMNGALERLVDASDFTTGWIFMINKHGHHTLTSDYLLPKSLSNNQCHFMTNGPCWCVTRYHQGKLTKASNIINCSRIVKANKQHSKPVDGITHHATVPLQSGSEKFGLLNVASPHKKSYSETELDLLESVAFQIGSAIKRIMLTEEQREVALTNERNRLARDLHDSVNQMLFSLKLTAHAAGSITNDDVAKQAFDMIEETSQLAVNEMRALIWQLKPIGLEQGLAHAITQYAAIINLNAKLHVDGLIQLNNEQETTVFRIVQEAMNNINKYARTKDVTIKIEQGDYFRVDIIDEGKGFDTTSITTIPTHGISNMKSRAESIGGMLDIKSKKNHGTTVTLLLKE